MRGGWRVLWEFSSPLTGTVAVTAVGAGAGAVVERKPAAVAAAVVTAEEEEEEGPAVDRPAAAVRGRRRPRPGGQVEGEEGGQDANCL